MRLTSVEARELFSFDRLQLDLPQTLVVVGQNGARKTNLLRLLQVVAAAIDRAATFSQDAYQALVRFAGSRRLAADSAASRPCGWASRSPSRRSASCSRASSVPRSRRASCGTPRRTRTPAESSTGSASTSARRIWRR